MSVHLFSLVFSRKFGSTARKAVACKLADAGNDDGSGVYPAVKTVAAEAEVCERTVQGILKEFCEEGILVVVEEGGGGRGKTTVYRFDMQKLHDLPLAHDRAKTPKPKGANPAGLNPVRAQIEQRKGADSAGLGRTGCTRPLRDPLEEPSARARGDRSGLGSEVKGASAPCFKIEASDVAWKYWLESLPPDQAEKARCAGVIETTARWPSNGHVLKIPKPPPEKSLSETSKRITGDAA